MNEVRIISKYNHPNIIRYYMCWIEIATLDDALQITSLLPDHKNSNSSLHEQ